MNVYMLAEQLLSAGSQASCGEDVDLSELTPDEELALRMAIAELTLAGLAPEAGLPAEVE